MANKLYEQFGANQGMIAQLKSQFMDMQKNFQGDPKQKVQELLNSGQMTQEQFNRLAQMANELIPHIR